MVSPDLLMAGGFTKPTTKLVAILFQRGFANEFCTHRLGDLCADESRCSLDDSAVLLASMKTSDRIFPYLPIVAAIPALLSSLYLSNFAAAPRALLVQQATVAITAIVAALFSVRYSKPSFAVEKAPWLLLGLAALVCAPLLGGEASTPHRWLAFFGFSLYIAPVVIPCFLLFWHRARAGSNLATIAAAFTGFGLFIQPDAAQLTAFAIASVPILGLAAGGHFVRIVPLATLLLAAAVSWSFPDSLAPVTYVEGVFVLAAKSSVWLLFSAILAVVLPIGSLGWLAYRMRSSGILAVSLYFAVLYLLAPIQVTPVPLLGFGAGPILGYFIMASQVGRCN